MNELVKPSTAAAYGQIAVATLFNIGAVYCLKIADGFARPIPSIAAMVMICMTQWLVSRAMASGVEMGPAIAMLGVFVMAGAAVMGRLLFKEPIPAQKAIGLGIAIIGMLIASSTTTQR